MKRLNLDGTPHRHELPVVAWRKSRKQIKREEAGQLTLGVEDLSGSLYATCGRKFAD